MTSVLALAMLSVAFVATLLAVTSRSTERLLWGSILSSVGLGLAVQLRGGSYYGLLMVAVFVITDLVLYLFFRSQKLLPAQGARHEKGDKLFRVFFLWLALCAVAGTVAIVFSPAAGELWREGGGTGLALLHERVWAADWLLLILPVLALVVIVTGGFFLVRKEQ